RSHFNRIRYQGLTHHGRLRRRHGRFEQRLIANATRPAVRRQDFAVNRLYRRDCEMTNCCTQDKRLKSAEFFLIKRFAAAAAFFESTAGRIGVSTMDPPSCTVTLSWSPILIRARSIKAAS